MKTFLKFLVFAACMIPGWPGSAERSLAAAPSTPVPPRTREIALTFDDSPAEDSPLSKSEHRTRELIGKLRVLNTPAVLIFANACKRADSASVLRQLQLYSSAGHLIGNHTCTHPRLDKVGFERYAADAARGDTLLEPLLARQSSERFFRFPFLNEGKEVKARDSMRQWLTAHHYRNGLVSVDDDDYLFSPKINQARKRGRKINYAKVQSLFLHHVMGAVEFYDALAVRTLGRSPRHVLLLHERDATVMFIEPLVIELRKQGWKIISAKEAYQDPLYLEHPRNTYANNGIIAQLAFERTGVKSAYARFDEINSELNRILGL